MNRQLIIIMLLNCNDVFDRTELMYDNMMFTITGIHFDCMSEATFVELSNGNVPWKAVPLRETDYTHRAEFLAHGYKVHPGNAMRLLPLN